MTRLHLHLLSDSTGETLEMIAKAALAQFDGAEVIRHFWPMVRSQQHLDRIFSELAANPGLVLLHAGQSARPASGWQIIAARWVCRQSMRSIR